MKDQIRNINNKQPLRGSAKDPLFEINDLVLFETISEYMKGWLDIEDVKNDPALAVANETVKDMITDYNKNISGNKESEKFIREILASEVKTDSPDDELDIIKKEINDHKLDELTSEWVREWHEKKQMTGVSDPEGEERRNFITGAINSTSAKPEKILNSGSKKVPGRRLFIRYASLSAAALIGVFILIRTLLPSSDTNELFNTYYKPFEAVSPVTRSINSNATDKYASSIVSYTTGNYQKATIGFAELLQEDQFVISSQFFLGLSQLATNNYDQAINLLATVANTSGEYGKEARWYLGLAYLKTANKQKASECFEYLASTRGFYSERSEKILRRLK
jgi:TolA-binding protein